MSTNVNANVNQNTGQQTISEKTTSWKKVFFWLSYLILLFVSVPHMAYVFAAFSDGSASEWVLAYAGALTIEASIYIASIVIYQLVKSKITGEKVFALLGLFGWILACTAVSWLSNSIHAAHFENKTMLTGSGNVPFAQYIPYVAGSWPIWALIFSFVSNVATKTYIEAKDDVRTIEQIQEDARKEQALEIAKSAIEQTRSEVRTTRTRTAIAGAVQATIGGFVGGLKDGVALVNNQEPIQIPTAEEKQHTLSLIPQEEEQIVEEEVEEPTLVPMKKVTQAEQWQNIDSDRITEVIEEVSAHVQEAIHAQSEKTSADIVASKNGHQRQEDIQEYASVAVAEPPRVEETSAETITESLSQDTIQQEYQTTPQPQPAESESPAQVELREENVQEQPIQKDENKNTTSSSTEIPVAASSEEWVPVTVRARSVKFDPQKDKHFVLNGTTFATLDRAYRTDGMADLKDARITRAKLQKLIDLKEIPAGTVRIVDLGRGKKITAIAVTPGMRDYLLKKIVKNKG